MKRIGIITFQKCGNLGADLQAFALCAKLRKMGYDAENIDYLHCTHPRHIKSPAGRPVLPMSPMNVLKARLFPLVKCCRERQGREERKSLFDQWFREHVKTGREYRDVESLFANPPQYDVYMTGGDQVWNPRLFSNIKPYFLDFAPEKAKCVSYASSFGSDVLKGAVFYKYKQWLKRYAYIGVREKSGADIIKSMGLGVEVRQVVDPTLLLTAEEWKRVAVPPKKVPDGSYLLLYDLLVSKETKCLAQEWAALMGVKIVRVGEGAYGPGEFLWLCEHAMAVVTNSFHGTVFSVINEKPFYSVLPHGASTSGRIVSFLTAVGLTDRIVESEKWRDMETSTEICYAKVKGKLVELVDDSVEFLKREIECPAVLRKPHLPLACYAAWNKGEAVRSESTSGGIFHVLAKWTIKSGGMVFGAAFAPDFHSVAHVAADTLDALVPLMKSKYVWSDPRGAYRCALSELQQGRRVLFAGTPCQIAAMKKMADGCDEKLVTVDIVCHGTPKAELFSAYIRELEERFGGEVLRYDFRDKKRGWNFSHVSANFKTTRRNYDKILNNDPYYVGFRLSATLRSACFSCPYTSLERVGDFSIADCWRVAASNPEWDDNKGTSLVLINTEKAKVLWEEILASGACGGGEYDLDLAQMRNMPLMQRPVKPKCYDVVQKVFKETGSFSAASAVYMRKSIVWRARLVYFVKKLGWYYFRRRQ